MTAGGGIIHQEMPKRYNGMMMGFQLWVNLPTSSKMMGPRYRDIKIDQIPEVEVAPGVIFKLISGEIANTRGPVKDLVIDTEYFDVTIEPETTFTHEIKNGYNAFCYVFEGTGYFKAEKQNKIKSDHVALFKGTEEINVLSDNTPLRYLFVSGKPLGEPVAWRGPIVMNTQEELDLAFREYHNGTFIK
jgi:redox-sensitive bicupin YhaK (pirin superfamily)